MTLAGIVAYYTTHPGRTRNPPQGRSCAAVRRELSPTIWPRSAVMGAWRAAKRTRAASRQAQALPAEQSTGEQRRRRAAIE